MFFAIFVTMLLLLICTQVILNVQRIIDNIQQIRYKRQIMSNTEDIIKAYEESQKGVVKEDDI